MSPRHASLSATPSSMHIQCVVNYTSFFQTAGLTSGFFVVAACLTCSATGQFLLKYTTCLHTIEHVTNKVKYRSYSMRFSLKTIKKQAGLFSIAGVMAMTGAMAVSQNVSAGFTRSTSCRMKLNNGIGPNSGYVVRTNFYYRADGGTSVRSYVSFKSSNTKWRLYNFQHNIVYGYGGFATSGFSSYYKHKNIIRSQYKVDRSYSVANVQSKTTGAYASKGARCLNAV